MLRRVCTDRVDSGRRIKAERGLADFGAVNGCPAPLRRSTARRPLS